MTTMPVSVGSQKPPVAEMQVGDAARDAALMKRFAAGDQQAFAMLARGYEAYLFGLARGVLGRRDDLAQEAVQETWVRVIRGAGAFRGESSFKTWVYRILVNRCLDISEREARQKRMRIGVVEAGGAGYGVEESDARAEGLAGAIERLTVAQRVVVLLCYHRGLTHAQAAEVLGLPLGTLKSRLNAGLEALRGMMGEGGEKGE
ncbi:MAG: sigma-70 family RNA polymerase sigma factor [Tepidisphaera sp.]|nr:sigma-70 family RNA polymerase sigma factor [Tepidisphaera sp.]